VEDPPVIPARIIEAKRDGLAVPVERLRAFLDGYLQGTVEDYHLSAFLMATYFQGLTPAETDVFVRAMVESGARMDLSYLPGPRVDKHSTGGVGDKVSLVLAPLAAEMGLFVPMMSGRGLGHTTGTLDKLEAIPGFDTALSLDAFRRVLESVGCAMIGQTHEIAPLDRRIYGLRDVTATVPIIPLIAASIMSKKLAEDLDGLLLDVKVGDGAFIPEEDRALELARTMVMVGEERGLRTTALLTAMDRPLGRAVGNGLETAEAIRCLAGEGPEDLEELCVREVEEMVALTRPDRPRTEIEAEVRAALGSGRALDRFVRMVEAQGGDPSVVEDPTRLEDAPLRDTVVATEEGLVKEVRPRPLGVGVVTLGGGRLRTGDAIDLSVGFEVLVSVGDRVVPGQPLGMVHARDGDGMRRGIEILRDAVQMGSGDAGELRPLISHRVDASGVTTADPTSGKTHRPDGARR